MHCKEYCHWSKSLKGFICIGTNIVLKCSLIIILMINNVVIPISNTPDKKALLASYLFCIWLFAFLLCTYELIYLLKTQNIFLPMILVVLIYWLDWNIDQYYHTHTLSKCHFILLQLIVEQVVAQWMSADPWILFLGIRVIITGFLLFSFVSTLHRYYYCFC